MPATWLNNLASEASTPDRFPSESLWGNFPIDEHNGYPGRYFHWFDDFHNIYSLTSATTAVNRYPYMSYIDSSDTIVALATEKMLGVVRLLTAATDNNAPIISFSGQGSSTGGNAVMLDDDTSGDNQPLWYEARWRKSSVTDNDAAIFHGFAEEARAIDNGLMTDDSGVPTTTIDVIGFSVLQDNGEELDFVYQKASQTKQELMAALDSLAAATWYKSGFRYQPQFGDVNKRIAIFQNEVEQATYATATQMVASTFPDGEEMTWYGGVKGGQSGGLAVSLDFDWIRIAQKMRDT